MEVDYFWPEDRETSFITETIETEDVCLLV